MIRLHMVVEGQTEEGFVNLLLVEHLAGMGIFADVRCVETSRTRRKIFRGGLLGYGRAKRDLHRWMKEDQNPEVRFTTMFDLYRLPADFPGYEDGKRKADPFARVRCLEESFGGDVSHPQFIPYIQLHEFEALLLSDPTKFDTVFLNHDRAIGRLCKMAVGFESPEQIDDGDATAPSKRIINEIRQYRSQKASAGPLIAEKIGLGNMRARCPHFREWLEKIEALAK